MNTKSHEIEVSGIPVEVIRKDIKNLHLGVYPPTGRVRVAAPLRVSDEAVRLAVVSRLAWVRRQQKRFQSQERQSPREMVSGETHYFKGRRYRLNVIETAETTGVRARSNNRLELRVPVGSTRSLRERVLMEWYRQRLRIEAAGLFDRWVPRIGVQVCEWGVRRMKTRWGTCNQSAKRIWLNVELAKKSRGCVELIVVHELIHLLHRHHDEAFVTAMTKNLPNWRSVREELNKAPLGHFDWEY